MKALMLVATICVPLASVVAGCGGETKTVTETTTVAVTAPPGQPLAPTETATVPAPVAEPLPGGRAALDGVYVLRTRQTSYYRENIVAGEENNRENWYMKPVCSGDVCRVELRRELRSGGFENFVLDETKDGNYVGTMTGKAECATGKAVVDARVRISLRVTAVAEINGRPTAQRADAYRTLTARCAGRGVRGIVAMRGSRER